MKRSLFYSYLDKFLACNKWLLNDNLRVLAYHTVPSKSSFQKQIRYLVSNYNVISIEQLKAALFDFKPLPRRPLLITFDDGDISVYENGFPVLGQYNLPSVLFVITELVDTNKLFWCRLVEKIYEKEGKSYAEARARIHLLKSISETERKKYLSSVFNLNGIQLNSKQVEELNSHRMFIGNHTHTHPMINNCTEDQIREEMEAARSKFIHMNLKENFSVFAYPNGNWEPKSEKVLMEEGIDMAFLFDHQLNENISNINPMRISRIRVNADDNLAEFKVKVSGLHSKILNLRRSFIE